MRRLVDYVLLPIVEDPGAESGNFGELLERLDCALVRAVLHQALRRRVEIPRLVADRQAYVRALRTRETMARASRLDGQLTRREADATDDGCFRACDAKTGKQLWTFKLGGRRGSDPVDVSGLLTAGSSVRKAAVARQLADRAGVGPECWERSSCGADFFRLQGR